MGRQPFVVVPNPDVPVEDQVWFFTAQAVSPGITAAEVWISLSVLTLLYGVLAVIEVGLITRFVRRGVTTGDHSPTPAGADPDRRPDPDREDEDRQSTRLNSSHANISYAVFCLKKKH